MDSGSKKNTLSYNPRKDANIFSILFFHWVTPLMRRGYRKELEQHDLYEALNEDHSDVVGEKLENAWNEELCKSSSGIEEQIKEKAYNKTTSNPKLLKVLMHTFGFYLLMPGILCFIEECIILILQPWFMGQLMLYFKLEGTSSVMSWIYAVGILLMSVCYNITHHLYFFSLQMLGMRLRVAVGSLIYRKALKLSNESLSKFTIGKIINLQTNDVNRFDNAVIFFHHLWIAPLQLLIVIYLTWQQVGALTFLCAGIVLLFMLLQGWLTKKAYNLRGETAKRTDERISLMNEIINGIKVIKMYAWETPFAELVKKIRKREIDVIQKNFGIRSFNYSAYMVFLKIGLGLILLAWVMQQNIVTPEIAFLTLSWYNVIRLSLMKFFPAGLSLSSEAIKSINRVEKFLLLEEFQERYDARKIAKYNNGLIENKTSVSHNSSINYLHAKNVFSKWNSNESLKTIKSISFRIGKGQCFGICGSVGAGKSSLLQTILGDLVVSSGEINLRGKLRYASQDPWIFDGTIRQNIIFGRKFDQCRYDDAIKLCCMGPDIASFKYGSEEFVGERGTTLSGGQKARLNLARSIYEDGDIYLLDDPLSAVDANVGKDLFQKCIRGHLKTKIVLLATHQLHFLKNVDKIIVLDDGEIAQFGTYEELCSRKEGRFSILLKETEDDADQEGETYGNEGSFSFRGEPQVLKSDTPSDSETGTGTNNRRDFVQNGKNKMKLVLQQKESRRNWGRDNPAYIDDDFDINSEGEINSLQQNKMFGKQEQFDKADYESLAQKQTLNNQVFQENTLEIKTAINSRKKL